MSEQVSHSEQASCGERMPHGEQALREDRASGRQKRAFAGLGRERYERAVSVIVILVVALAFQLAQMPGNRGAAFALLVIVAVVLSWAWIRFVPHVVRMSKGWAVVRTRRAPDGSRIRVLSQGGVYQSATYLDERRFEPVFAYQQAFDAAFAADDTLRAQYGHGVQRVLAIGGGGFAWPKHVALHYPQVAIDVAELDPAIINAARTWFFLDEAEVHAEGRLRVYCEDGRVTLARAGEPYDAIVNDAFCGSEPVRALATVEAARAVRNRLTPGGLYLVNVVSRENGSELAFLRDVVATLFQVFSRVQVLIASDERLGGEDNYLVVATDGDVPLPDAIPFDDDFLGTPLWDGDLR